MDKLQSIRFFLKVSETLSFKHAAIHFGVPASTVSRAIKGLEEELGVVLFERTTRQVRLTEAGGWYSAEVVDPIRALAAADDMVKAQALEPAGTLRITALPGYGEIRLFDKLDEFRSMYPNVVCDVVLTDRYLDLSTGEVDIALRATADPPDYLVAKRLHSNRFVMVGSPDYLKRQGKPTSVADIVRHDSLGYRGPNGIAPCLLRTSAGDVVPVARTFSLISNHGLQVLEATRQGQGLAFLPLWGVADSLEDGSLEQVTIKEGDFVKSTGPEMSIFLLFDPLKARLGKVRVMVDFLMRTLKEE